MCNSYNNGHCNYYGVEVRELNYKCERGVCMTNKKAKCVPYVEPIICVHPDTYKQLVAKGVIK